MLTKDDFLRVIEDTTLQYPMLSALQQAGDPRIKQPQAAIAQMFAMLSQQIEVGGNESFEKARDSTVLADAAVKGLMPLAKPGRIRVKAQNADVAPFEVVTGRQLLDSAGKLYVVDKPVTVPAAQSTDAPGTAYVELVQRQVRTLEHTVTESKAFYTVEVTKPDDGRYISGIAVSSATVGDFRYAPQFVNVGVGDAVYHVESDEYQRLFVKFGYGDVVGYQPSVGDVLVFTITETDGDVRPAVNSPLAFEYAYTVADSSIKLTFDALLSPGFNPAGISTLRELCRYPSTYDDNAVYLSGFDFLIRRHRPDLRFLSVWNEQLEERVRGANLKNINRLFIAFEPPIGADRASVQAEIEAIVMRADDGYRVSFVLPIVKRISAAISCSIARVHEPASVREQIAKVILNEWGEDAPSAKRGMAIPQYKRVYKLLRDAVPALQDDGSDFQVQIAASDGVILPEQWRFVSSDSLTVDITPANYNINVLGY